jgi:2-succinyl-6-hydroxy-2,4-cyclohexadiene-1-carboxylate synthase
MSFRIRFHYKFYGDPEGPIILFLHGFMGNGGEWRNVCQYLSEKFYCLIIDLPFHGKTLIEGDENEITFEGTASSIMQLLANLNIHRCHLVGYSMGGRIALYLALNYPEPFIRVLLESASPGLKTEQEKKARREADAVIAQKLRGNFCNEFLVQWYRQPIFGDFIRQPNFKEIQQRRLKGDPQKLAFSLKKLGTGVQPSSWEKLPQLDKCCLLVVGEKDLKFRNIAEEIKKLNDMISIEKVSDCYHDIHSVKPDIFAGLILDFFLN